MSNNESNISGWGYGLAEGQSFIGRAVEEVAQPFLRLSSLGDDLTRMLQGHLGVEETGVAGPETVAAFLGMADELGIEVEHQDDPEITMATIEAIAAINMAVGAHGAEIDTQEQQALMSLQQKIGSGEVQLNANAMAELQDVIEAMAASGNTLQSEEVSGAVADFAASLTVPGQGAAASEALGR